MYCSNCGKQLPDESIACSYCATVFNSQTPTSASAQQQTESPKNNHSNFSQYYSAQQNEFQSAPIPNQLFDAGHGYALACMLCGILSLFVGGIFCAIASLILANSYQKIGNGANADKIKTGKICSWICIGLTAGVIIFYILAFSVLLISGMA